MYRRTTYDCGQVIDVQCYYPGNYGAPGKKRGKKQKRTPEDIARQNQTSRVLKVKRLIRCNFRKGDWHLTLNYRKGERPETIEEAKSNLTKFLGAIRKELKKQDMTFRYIGVTEIGKKGQALHHHLIIEDLTIGGKSIVELASKTVIPNFPNKCSLLSQSAQHRKNIAGSPSRIGLQNWIALLTSSIFRKINQ